MARTKAPVQKTDVEFPGKARDAKLLRRFANEQGRDAVPFVEEAFAQGGVAMRRAAFEALCDLDARSAQRLATDQLAEAEGQSTKAAARQRKEALALLLRVGTEVSVRTFFDRGGSIERRSRPEADHEVQAQGAVFRVLAERAPQLAKAEEVLTLLSRGGIVDAHDPIDATNRPHAEALAACLLDRDEETAHRAGERLWLAASGADALEPLESRGHRPDVKLVASVARRWLPPAQLKGLSRYVNRPDERPEALSAITRPDAGWAPILEPFIDEPKAFKILFALRHPAAMQRMRDLAAKEVFDVEAKQACFDLGIAGDGQATRTLIRWLSDPVVREPHRLLLLTALARCGTREALPALAELSASDGVHTDYYQHAAQRIRARLDAQ